MRGPRPPEVYELAAKLWWLGLLRGLAALALGAYVLARAPMSPAMIARAVAVYWILDGLAVLWASVVAVRLAMNRTSLIARTVAGIAAAFTILGLPLREVFGPWQPGQFLMLLSTVGLALTAIGLQVILAATFDVMVGLEVRRRVPGEWSLLLAATLSIVLGALIGAALVFAPAIVLGRGLGVVSIAGALAVAAAAVRLRLACGRPSLPAVTR